MNGDRIAAIIGLLGALILAGSGVLRRRMRVSEMLRLAALWIALIAVAWLLVAVASSLRRS